MHLPKESMPLPSKPIPLNCNKIVAKVGVTQWPFEFKNLDRYSIVDKNGYYYDESESLREELSKQIPIDFQTKNSSEKSLVLGFSVYHRVHNYGWAWLSALTYGLVPIKLDAEGDLELRVYDEEGNFIKEYKSSKFETDVYIGVWFLPLALSNRWRTAKELLPDRMAFALNELLQQAAQDRIFNCN